MVRMKWFLKDLNFLRICVVSGVWDDFTLLFVYLDFRFVLFVGFGGYFLVICVFSGILLFFFGGDRSSEVGVGFFIGS